MTIDLNDRVISHLIDTKEELTRIISRLETENEILRAESTGVRVAVDMMKAGREEEQQLIEKFIADWNKLHTSRFISKGEKQP